MESTELQDIDFYSSFYDHTNSTFFTPTTSSLLSDSVSEDPVSPKPQNEDQDAYVAELTRQMTNYMLQDDEKHQKSCSGGSGSPQSTLWSPFHSGNSSPIGPSREPTPPQSPVTVETKPVMVHSQSKQALIDDQIRSIQANFHKIKKEKDKQRNNDVVGHKARNYQYQQRPRSGVKAVFVDGSGSKTGSGGTGVFLPRCHGTVVESRKKSDAMLVSMKNKNIKSNKSSSSTRAQSGPLYTSETSVESHQEPPADLPHEWTY
ncbi:uncharacterized protein LOC108823551 isoform X2 [Raphanus sativus]|uniref:Uncharacterized protein LOC108823551 isoform X2 n=1 Tax=Raphanus sativus TaxID=3726 RepID=A0A9W3D3X7_RAPSA|nr:uncharacterized protein LOC108823551 isoform X2 [Raphanus sativus]